MEICLKHQQLFAKGIGLEYFPDVQEALDGIVPLRYETNIALVVEVLKLDYSIYVPLINLIAKRSFIVFTYAYLFLICRYLSFILFFCVTFCKLNTLNLFAMHFIMIVYLFMTSFNLS